MTTKSDFESVIFSNLINDEAYARQAIPFLKSDYFQSRPDKLIFTEIERYFTKYNRCPDITALQIEAESFKVSQDEITTVMTTIKSLPDVSENKQWLLDKTEKFCKDKSIFLAIMKSIEIIDGKDENHSTDALPALLADAISVSFDKSVGHDFFNNAEARYDFLHAEDSRLPFDLEMFNKITHGGLKKKTLSAILAGTGVGKTFFMCHLSSAQLRMGKNVLYITMEMSEEEIATRIDCNILDVEIENIGKLNKNDYVTKLSRLHEKTRGELIVKEYPTGGAHVGHFRALLNELKLKKDFAPDFICVDYMNICASQRVKNTAANSYTIVKSIAEELRAMAVEFDVPIFTGTQATRNGNNNSDISITDTSESFGTPATLDFFIAATRTQELDDMGQLMITQLKSRFGDINYYRKFVIGSDIKKFKLYNVENTAYMADSGYKSESSDKFNKPEKDFDFDFS